MPEHYFENDLASLHYYKFGSGPKAMLCFHGYGMHGRQFKLLGPALGEKYTFYSFDLFFHELTKLKNQSLAAVKAGISKQALAALFAEFCKHEGIERFSLIGYSMGTHYSTVIVEELPQMVDEFIAIAPSSLAPGSLITFFSKNKIGNKILEKVALGGDMLIMMLKLFKKLRFINAEAYEILYNEIGTPELRLNFYSCFVYLRYLETNEAQLLKALNGQNIKSIFIFGQRDKSFPPTIGKHLIAQLKNAQVIILNEGHDLIKKSFVAELTEALL